MTKTVKAQELVRDLEPLWGLIQPYRPVRRRTVYEVLTATSYWLEAAVGSHLLDEVWEFMQKVETRDDEMMPGEVAHAFFAIIRWRLLDASNRADSRLDGERSAKAAESVSAS